MKCNTYQSRKEDPGIHVVYSIMRKLVFATIQQFKKNLLCKQDEMNKKMIPIKNPL